MTALVTLVVQSVLAGVFVASLYLLIGHLPAPGDHHIVDIDGVMPGPQHLLIYPEKSSLKDEGFDKAHDMPD